MKENLKKKKHQLESQLSILNKKLDRMEKNIESDDDLIDEMEILKVIEKIEMELKQVKIELKKYNG